MTNKRQPIALVLLAALLWGLILPGCSSRVPVETEETESPNVVVQVNPLAESASTDEILARLYYGYGSSRLLAGENRRVKVPMNESVETSILNELIHEGPSAASVNFTAVINPNTTVVSTTSEGQYMTVTFSREFLEPYSAQSDVPRTGESERIRRYLAVYSVVNTLIEQSTCSRVRIMIDEDGTGTGRPITFAEAGVAGAGDAEPFARNGDIELTPDITMLTILDGVERKDWAQVYELIAFRNQYGQDRPSMDEFRAQAENARISLVSPSVVDYVMMPDGANVVVMVSYDVRPQNGEVQSFTNVPKRLVLENDVWKMTWNVFEQTFLA